jgi:hypothetical protein
MKKGLIYTLYKGSRKYDDDRKNYRDITLLPVIGKLFDKVVLSRLKSWIKRENVEFPSTNQQAYQESLCSILASFEVQETICYNLERQSKTYLALIDSSSAFDLVWHNGLFVKLHNMGIKGKLWRLLVQNYHNMSSKVVFNGMTSSDIQIKRSVRQGSVLGPWLYMVFIHNLSVTLHSSPFGCKLGQVSCGGILQADDIAIMALTPFALQELIKICEVYSNTWRYKYNPVKSKVIVFGETQRSKQKAQHERKFTLYDKAIEEVIECSHVGVILNAYQNNSKQISNCVSNVRGGLMAILGSGVDGMSCLSAIKLYKSIVLPRGLYGAELWSELSKNEVSKVERAHRFCLKYIQHLPKRTKTVINGNSAMYG